MPSREIGRLFQTKIGVLYKFRQKNKIFFLAETAQHPDGTD